MWIPPTDVSELPADYKTRFMVAGKEIADFDVFKTWTEYLNRLLGAIIGMAIIGVVVCSYAYKGRQSKLIIGSWLSLGLVIFQGWVGAVVVKTHLASYMITIHMLLALLLVALILFLLREAQAMDAKKFFSKNESFRNLGMLLLFLSLIQIVLGTQVREAIDHVIKSNPSMARAFWVENTGWIFLIHRSFSIVILLAHYKLWKNLTLSGLFKFRNQVTISFAITLLSGIALAYLGFPAWLQPIHLLVALVLCTQYFDLKVNRLLA
jgi:cytochrome c oxidase assembly protein subunit 15